MYRMKSFLEMQVFGVCAYLGEKLSMPIAHLRLFFIYASFLAIGSPIIIYLGLALLLKLRNYIHGKINPIWDV